MNKIILYLILIIMTIFGSFGGFFLKKATLSKKVKNIIFSYNFFLGGGLYFISALINIYLLRYLAYTIVLPLTSITYIWTLLISKKYFKEQIGQYKKIGVTVIIIGVLFISLK